MGASKLVFLDVDGTIIDENQQIPDSARIAIAGAKEAGHRLFLATGRSKIQIYPWLFECGFRGIVGDNGAYGELDGRILVDRRFSREEIDRVTDYMEAHKMPWCWQGPEALSIAPEFLGLFTRWGGRDSEETSGDWSDLMKLLEPHIRYERPNSACKLTFVIEEESTKTIEEVAQDFSGEFDVVDGSIASAKRRTGELTHAGMNKGLGLVTIAKTLGETIDNTIAFGDSANDVEMLRVAGTAVAMGNATPEAKRASSFVTTSVQEDGLARGFVRLGLVDPEIFDGSIEFTEEAWEG